MRPSVETPPDLGRHAKTWLCNAAKFAFRREIIPKRPFGHSDTLLGEVHFDAYEEPIGNSLRTTMAVQTPSKKHDGIHIWL